ncbi:MAG: hypothetical protein Q7T13_09570 [Polaromonas sp.]|nr:hypothetical protein [Polaromonas sp.]
MAAGTFPAPVALGGGSTA